MIVLADIDDDLENGEQLKQKYWETAQTGGKMPLRSNKRAVLAIA